MESSHKNGMTETTPLTEEKEEEEEDEFTLENIAPGIFLCRERYYNSFNVANLYLVQGRDMDLIIDTGLGIWDFPGFLKKKGMIDNHASSNNNNNNNNKPYQAVVTHVHFDHAGGLYQFNEKFAIHEAEAGAIQTGDSYEAVCFMSKAECAKPPSETWKARDYKLQAATPSKILQDGDCFDLGDRRLQVLHLPGHSRGSIGLWDDQHGIFFSGDVIYDGYLFDCLPYSNIADYIQSFERLLALSPQIERVFPGHDDLFGREKLQEMIQQYLDKAGTCHDCMSLVQKGIFTIVFKGRNTREACPRCCYFSCCCCLCV